MRSIGLGLVPVTPDPAMQLAVHEFASELGEILGGTIEVRIAPSPGALADDYAEGRSELLWSSPVLALAAPQLQGAVPLVCSVREGVAYYHSVLVVRKSSPIRSPLDLHGTRAVWVAPTSASGYLFPRIALAGHGVDPRGLFASESFVGAHGAVVEAIQRGEADVGATFAVFRGGDASAPLLRAGHHETAGEGEELRVLLPTPPIPADLFVASPRLHAAHGALLVRALEETARRAPRAALVAFGADSLVATSERELAELRRQLTDAQAIGLFEPP